MAGDLNANKPLWKTLDLFDNVGPTQHPTQWAPGAISLGVKRPGREVDHSPPSSAEVKECVELYLHSPNTPSWRGAYLKHRDNFSFTFTFTYLIMTSTFHRQNIPLTIHHNVMVTYMILWSIGMSDRQMSLSLTFWIMLALGVFQPLLKSAQTGSSFEA
jgi:hypothetical protein